MSFQSPVTYPDGVASTSFAIPDVPVSQFELSLPGDKYLQVSAAGKEGAQVDSRQENEHTIASFFIPMSQQLQLTWMDAIPQDVATQRRANAAVFHALFATEGVLYGKAAIRYDITRGDAKVLDFAIPYSAQVNQLTSSAGAIADWIVVDSDTNADTKPQLIKHIRVFLNRVIEGEFILNIEYEQLLEDHPDEVHALQAPLILALNVARQKGMVALLSGSDLALAPVEHPEMSEVGENQLPAFFRNQFEQTISHTYKYHSTDAALTVRTVTPERRQGKFNAQIDTLISIGDVTLKGQVSIEIDVKSGVLRNLRLALPADVNILGVSGPSIRNHVITTQGERQFIDIEFTQEMDGQFRIELNYERIMLDGGPDTNVPHIEVADADVEHGRIAIEALAALEVQASVVEHLSSLEINELPRQLVLKTTNPILLAYKYVQTENPFKLQLRITRHQEIDVQVAAIDSAHYTTLFTADGLAVTRVAFDVRNSRRQFLRLSLPPGTEIWSVFVNGKAQKPAVAPIPDGSEEEDASDVLIKMINSSTAFPVELVYATRGAAMQTFGVLAGRLPRPDMIVTRSIWDVYVPDSPRYSDPKTNMNLLDKGIFDALEDVTTEILRGTQSNVMSGEPLHIELPTQGLRYRFAKLYANQAPEEAKFSIRYVHRSAGFVGSWISLLAALAFWGGVIVLGMKNGTAPDIRFFGLPARLPTWSPWALVAAAPITAVLSITVLGASVVPASALSLVIAALLALWHARAAWQRRSAKMA